MLGVTKGQRHATRTFSPTPLALAQVGRHISGCVFVCVFFVRSLRSSLLKLKCIWEVLLTFKNIVFLTFFCPTKAATWLWLYLWLLFIIYFKKIQQTGLDERHCIKDVENKMDDNKRVNSWVWFLRWIKIMRCMWVELQPKQILYLSYHMLFLVHAYQCVRRHLWLCGGADCPRERVKWVCVCAVGLASF